MADDTQQFQNVTINAPGLLSALANKLLPLLVSRLASDSAFRSALASALLPGIISETNLYLRANPPVPGQPQKL